MQIHIEPIELVFLLLAAAVALTYVARRLRIAEPILLLFGGLVRKARSAQQEAADALRRHLEAD